MNSNDKNQQKEAIKKALEEFVNPQLASHNGAAELKSFENGIATVKLIGACASCMMAEETLQAVVKTSVLNNCPFVEDVVLDQSVDDDLIDFARNLLNKSKK